MTHPHLTRRQLFPLVAGAAVLTACTPTESTPSPGGTGADGAPAGRLEVVWPGTSDPEMAVAESFAEAMSGQGIEIEYNFLSWADMQQQLAVRIQAGNPPDLTMTQDTTDLVAMGGLRALDDLFEASDFSRDQFRPGTLEYSTHEGSLYALPYSAQAFDLIVNTELLSAKGVSVEDLGTWADLESAAAELTGDGVYGFAYPLQNPRFAFRGALTAGYSNDLNIGDTDPAQHDKWIELLGHLAALAPSRPSADVAWAYPEMFRAFANGEVAMIPAGTFFTANVYELNPGIVEVSKQIVYPAGPSGTAQAPVSNTGFAIFEGSANADLAWHVIQQLMAPEFLARLNAVAHVPALSTVTEAELANPVAEIYPSASEAHLQQIVDQIDLIDSSGTALIPIPGQPAMEPEFQALILDFLNGAADAETTYTALMERFDAAQA